MSGKDDTDDPRCYGRGDPKTRELAEKHGLSSDAAAAVADIDETMSRIRRSMAKREFGRRVMAHLDANLDVAHMDVIGVVGHEASEPAGVSVGTVAERLGIDPSRASRLVAEVVERGYVLRVASQTDARRICLELTEKGTALIDAVRETKWRVFSKSLGRWTEDELVTFARLLDRFSHWTTDFSEADAVPVKTTEQA